MPQHKTRLGRPINMQALASAHEKTRAVSNVPINARGDIVDGKNKVVVRREDVTKEYYKTPPAESVEVSLKEDLAPVAPTPEPAPAPKPKAKSKPKPEPEPIIEPDQFNNKAQKHEAEFFNEGTGGGEIELNRSKKTREDGSEYWEIEYSDGSMMDVDIK